ncbi:alpha/beta hydrolase [Litoribacillus peritrichatus]|uniref:Alpha/beta hydrolase n=1 Tax=Litoribacillus peritrichatus TaxID=718191 RepID=A0ABP7MD34_9GAMM
MTFTEKRLDLGYLSVAYKEWGEASGELPVLFFHGWLDNANSFDLVISGLSKDRRYLAFDLTGHGHSEHRPEGQLYHFLDGVADIRRIFDALELEKAIVVGHSLGAALLSAFSSAYPELVDRVALIEAVGPISNNEAEIADQLRDSVDKQLIGSGNNMAVYPDLETMAKARQRGIGGLGFEASRKLVERSSIKVENGYEWSSDPRLRVPSPMRLSESQVKGFLTKITSPLKLILAEKSLIPAEMIEKRLTYFSDYQMSVFPGGHHLHMEESASLVAEALNLFIQTEH